MGVSEGQNREMSGAIVTANDLVFLRLGVRTSVPILVKMRP